MCCILLFMILFISTVGSVFVFNVFIDKHYQKVTSYLDELFWAWGYFLLWVDDMRNNLFGRLEDVKSIDTWKLPTMFPFPSSHVKAFSYGTAITAF